MARRGWTRLLPPRLDDKERDHERVRSGDSALHVVHGLIELGLGHQTIFQYPAPQRIRELRGGPHVRLAVVERERDAARVDFRETSLALEAEQLATCVEASTTEPEALSDHVFETFEAGRLREATPPVRLGFFLHDEAAGLGDSYHLGQQIAGSAHRRDEKPRVDQVEGARLELSMKGVALYDLNVG